MIPAVLWLAALVVVLAPCGLLATLVLPSLVGRPLGEAAVGAATRVAAMLAFIAAGVALLTYLFAGRSAYTVFYGTWFGSREHGFVFALAIDGLSLGFATLATGISGVVASFSYRYLHLDPGYRRYFVQFALFALGINLIALAGTIEVLFVGWELLGLSSALLVAYFHERRAPAENALRVFAVYRVSDAAMLGAAVLLHHWAETGSLAALFAAQALPGEQLVIIAVLLIVAVAGKSALLPFSGWLPRAMEGPTPSSAVYYGALSIHAGCFLLLRAEPLLAQSNVARGLACAAGASTAIYAALVARVQTDAKSALAFASLTQVGIIIVEISLGLTTVAFVHLAGHACFRLLQFLAAPNLLHDLHDIEGRAGDGPRPRAATMGRARYLFALERGFVDALVDRVVIAPLVRLVGWLDQIDHWLVGRRRR